MDKHVLKLLRISKNDFLTAYDESWPWISEPTERPNWQINRLRRIGGDVPLKDAHAQTSARKMLRIFGVLCLRVRVYNLRGWMDSNHPSHPSRLDLERKSGRSTRGCFSTEPLCADSREPPRSCNCCFPSNATRCQGASVAGIQPSDLSEISTLLPPGDFIHLSVLWSYLRHSRIFFRNNSISVAKFSEWLKLDTFSFDTGETNTRTRERIRTNCSSLLWIYYMCRNI